MKKSLKIAMIIDGWNPIFGGGQVHVNKLVNGIINNYDGKVDLFVRKLKDNNGKKYTKDEVLLNGNFKIFRVGLATKFFNIFGRIFSLIFTTFYLLYKAKKEKYDLIHAFSYVSGLPAIIVGKILKIPVVYTVLGANNMELGNTGLIAYIEKYLLTKIKYNREISVLNDFLKFENINDDIAVIPNGVYVDKFNQINDIEKYTGFNLLWVGRYNWEKGLEYLIRGLSLVDKTKLRSKDFKLNLVGDGEDRKKIEELILELNLGEFVNIKGKVFGEDLVKEYKSNTMFILPSLTEGQPLTVLEAFASKLSVIATDVGDNKYFVNDNNGFLIHSKSEEEIKNIIEKVLEIDIKELDQRGKRGYELVKENYTWGIMVDKVYNVYKKEILNYKV